MNAENSLTALLPGATVFCTKFRIVQGQFRWKIESVGFPQTLVSTRSKHRKTLNCQSKKGAQRTKNSSKSCRNQTKRAEQATREAHAASSYMEQCVATPRSTMLHESLYKYGSNFDTERSIFREIRKFCLSREWRGSKTKRNTVTIEKSGQKSKPFLSSSKREFQNGEEASPRFQARRIRDPWVQVICS